MTKEDVLKGCTVKGNIVKLPDEQLDRKLYLEVANSLKLIGGVWRGKPTFGFVFPQDPTELLEKVAGGEKKNLKKEYQFFETGSNEADRIVALAEINESHFILEPSAGQGAIIKAIQRVIPECDVWYYELMDVNITFLRKIPHAKYLGTDFLKCDRKFDRIIGNPPFSKNQDIIHIRKMYECLKPGGRLVSIASKHWQMSNNKKETEFREWLDEVNAEVQEIEAGAFKKSGTMISSVIIIINKK